MYEKCTPLAKRCNLTFKFLAIRDNVKGRKTTKKGRKTRKNWQNHKIFRFFALTIKKIS